MCHQLYVIMHVKDPYTSVVRVGNCALLAGSAAQGRYYDSNKQTNKQTNKKQTPVYNNSSVLNGSSGKVLIHRVLTYSITYWKYDIEDKDEMQ